MGVRRIDYEPRLGACLAGLSNARARSRTIPSTLVERQRRDHRTNKLDSSKPAAVIATVAAITSGQGVSAAIGAASGGSGGGYYSGRGYSGRGYGGGG